MEEVNISFTQREIEAILGSLEDFSQLADEEQYNKRFVEGLSQAWYKLERVNAEQKRELDIKDLYIIEDSSNKFYGATYTMYDASKIMENLNPDKSYTLSCATVVAHRTDSPIEAYIYNYDDAKGHFTCESIQAFATSIPTEESVKMLVIEPGEYPCVLNVIDDLPCWQAVVGGDIECTYPLGREYIVVGNEEARVIGMEGNRHINGTLYAGNILIGAPDDEGGVQDLTDKQITYLTNNLSEPEEITAEEVSDYGYEIFFC